MLTILFLLKSVIVQHNIEHLRSAGQFCIVRFILKWIEYQKLLNSKVRTLRVSVSSSVFYDILIFKRFMNTFLV